MEGGVQSWVSCRCPFPILFFLYYPSAVTSASWCASFFNVWVFFFPESEHCRLHVSYMVDDYSASVHEWASGEAGVLQQHMFCAFRVLVTRAGVAVRPIPLRQICSEKTVAGHGLSAPEVGVQSLFIEDSTVGKRECVQRLSRRSAHSPSPTSGACRSSIISWLQMELLCFHYRPGRLRFAQCG